MSTAVLSTRSAPSSAASLATSFAASFAASFVLPERFARIPAMAAVALLPWLGVLAVCHETPWVVLDLVEFSALLSLDALLRRRSPAALWAGAAVALLLTGDALADIAFAGPGHAVLAALVMACCIELPLAVVCLLLGRAAAVRA
ncbi:hypothetical protein BX285_2489 [Streptomyces sp. 1114.5]|uniref:hypothetical protein n=1 Tax=Streptomyces sp. 1114.5 TaxID=1938830 RepID=UPI000EB23F20|nr:hypothetical protein [Streptomyces sp. 1114.5]RKT18076.1 hypothetical protein BX285_2489 [Streptomyces sp. 1114.5]